jgi:N-formylglutamate amidohydrolase
MSDPTPAELAQTINRAIETVALPRFGDRRVYISGLYDFVNEAWGGLDRATFDRLLVDANRQHLLTLGRADHVVAMDPELVAASHIHPDPFPGLGGAGSDFHFVLDEDARSRPRPRPPAPAASPTAANTASTAAEPELPPVPQHDDPVGALYLPAHSTVRELLGQARMWHDHAVDSLNDDLVEEAAVKAQLSTAAATMALAMQATPGLAEAADRTPTPRRPTPIPPSPSPAKRPEARP